MRSLLLKCEFCKEYTLKPTCPRCGKSTKIVIPARFSPEDHYGKYRRKLKLEMLEKKRKGE